MNRRFISKFGVTVLVFSILIHGYVEGYPPRTGYSQEISKNNAQNPKVLFALKVWEHWSMVPGGSSPIFILYEDRSIIYFDKNEKVRKHVVLSEDEFARLGNILLNPHILTLNDYYSTIGATCQNMYHFFFRISGLIYPITVYGHPTMTREGVTLPPKEIREIFSLVTHFKHEDTANWLPAKIEVLFWSYDYAPDESIIWPDDWPDLSDSSTVKRGDSSYSVFLDSKHLDELKDFIKTRREKGAVLINGQKMSISYRISVPGENFPGHAGKKGG